MPEPLRISSVVNPRVKALVRLREQRERRATGLFVAEGLRCVARAVRAGLRLHEMHLCPERLSLDAAWSEQPDLRPWLGRAQGGAITAEPVFLLSEPVFLKAAYQENPEGILGVFEQRNLDLGQALGRAGDDRPVLVAERLAKPGNLGAMARSAAAADAAALLAADSVVDIWNPNAIHASTGAVFDLPIACGSTAAVIEALRARGCRIFPAIVGAATGLWQADLRGRCALAIGAEDQGLSRAWADAAAASGGACLGIPMRAGLVDSLNASVAAGVLLFEAMRQRLAPSGRSSS